MKKRDMLVLMGLLLCGLLLMSACGGSGAPAEAPRDEPADEPGIGEPDAPASDDPAEGEGDYGDRIVYVEPITGTRIVLPAFFSSPEEQEYTNNTAAVKCFLQPLGTGDYEYMQLDISVEETGATCMDDVFERLMFDYDTPTYVVASLTENSITVEESSKNTFGDVKYYVHIAYLLEEGSHLYVRFTSEDKEVLSVYRDMVVAYGAEPGGESLALAANIQPDPAALKAEAGIWYNAKEGVWLYMPGGVLTSLYQEDGTLIAHGAYDSFWENFHFADFTESGDYDEGEDTMRMSGFSASFAREEALPFPTQEVMPFGLGETSGVEGEWVAADGNGTTLVFYADGTAEAVDAAGNVIAFAYQFYEEYVMYGLTSETASFGAAGATPERSLKAPQDVVLHVLYTNAFDGDYIRK